jgi:hypothetical protein
LFNPNAELRLKDRQRGGVAMIVAIPAAMAALTSAANGR